MKITKEYIEKKLKKLQAAYDHRRKTKGEYYSDRKDGKHWLVAAYKPSKGVFRISKNCDLYIHEDGTIDGRSYKWWSTVRTVKGKVVFNKYRYSVTTAKHQNNLRRALWELGIKIDYEFESPEGFQAVVFNRTVSNYLYNIGMLKAAIKDKSTSKKKNDERKKSIQSLENELALFITLFDVPRGTLKMRKEKEARALEHYQDEKQRKAKRRAEQKAAYLASLPRKNFTKLGEIFYK